MKLPKSLLGALVVGIATQTALTSCTKEKLTPEQKKEAELKKEQEKQKNAAYNCPACGMG